MEKVALFELGTTSIRLTLSNVIDNEHFFVYRELSELVKINENIEGDGLIKSAKIKEYIALLQMYKKICDADGIKKFLCVCSNTLQNAKNYQSFIDEASSAIGLEFKMLTAEEEVSTIYTSVVNTLDVPKGVIINITSHATRIIHYNRRVILDNVTIPYGSVSLFDKVGVNAGKNQASAAVELFKQELSEKAAFLSNLDPETSVIGVSDVFVSFARIARKMNKSPLDIDHSYVTNSDEFTKVFDFIKGLDVEKQQKLKGISSHSASTILCGMCIIDAALQHSKLKNIVVGCSYRNIGLMFNFAIPYTLERPVSDVLGYSLETIAYSAGLDKKFCEQHYALSLLLFKQLKVLHKLPRFYAKVMRIASYLYQLGKKINCENYEKNNYAALLNSPIMGASHKEIVLAAFCAACKRWEDFNLSEWVKYKDICTPEDLEAVRKISNIVAIAEAFNIRNSEIVKDISCDILGDSVILKLITDTDVKNTKVDVKAAYIEIFYAKKYSAEFVKAFKKNLEIL